MSLPLLDTSTRLPSSERSTKTSQSPPSSQRLLLVVGAPETTTERAASANEMVNKMRAMLINKEKDEWMDE